MFRDMEVEEAPLKTTTCILDVGPSMDFDGLRC